MAAAAAILMAGALGAGLPGAAGAAEPRAYELASNVPDHGQEVANGFLTRDGEHVIGQSALGGALGDSPSGMGTTLLANRTDAGWTAAAVNGPANMTVLTWTPSFSSFLFSTGGALDPADTDPGAADVYQRDADGAFSWLSQGPAGTNANLPVTFAGASADGEHVLFTTTEVLDPVVAGKTATRAMLYERSGGVTRAVGLADDGTLIDVNGAVAGTGYSHNAFFGDNPLNIRNAISADGSRIFFSAPDNNTTGAKPEIYVRSDGHTIKVTAPAPGVVSTVAAKRYEGATADGSKVWFTTTQKLTADDADTSSDLYQYDVDTATLTRLSAGASGTGAGVSGAVQYTDDGSTLYFIGTGLLVPGKGTAGQPNLYVLHGGVIDYIATLVAADSNPLATGAAAARIADITPDGTHLVFLSAAKLVAEDTDAKRDAYEYDATTGTLTLVSGGSGAFDAAFWPSAFGGSANLRRGSVSDDGSVVVFQTTEALLPEDTNTVADVYERRDGELLLVSTGTSTYASEAMGVSADGNDVLIRTRDSLAEADDDGGVYDLYDARIGGGFPEPPAPPAPCEGDACQGTPTPQPARTAPGSAAFSGPETITPGSAPLTIPYITVADRLAFGRTGKLNLAVKLGVPGTVDARVRASMGRGTLTVAHVTRDVKRPVTAHLLLKLSDTARRALRRHGRLTVRIEVRLSGVADPETVSMTLRSTGAAKRSAK